MGVRWPKGGGWGGGCPAPKPHKYAANALRGGRGGSCSTTTQSAPGGVPEEAAESTGCPDFATISFTPTSTTSAAENPVDKPTLGVVVTHPNTHPTNTWYTTTSKAKRLTDKEVTK